MSESSIVERIFPIFLPRHAAKVKVRVRQMNESMETGEDFKATQGTGNEVEKY